MLAAQGIAIATGSALSVLLARFLQPQGYGLYLLVLTISQTVATPILAGLPALVTREVAIYRAKSDWARLRGMLRWSLNVVAITSAAMALLAAAYLLVTGVPTNFKAVYLLALPMTACLIAMQLASALIKGHERPFWGNLPDGTIRPILLLLLAGVAAATGVLTPAIAMAAHILAAGFAAAWAFHYWRRHLDHLSREGAQAKIIENRTWFLSLLPLSLLTTGSLLSNRLDVLMLGALATKADVALYGIAMQLAGLAALPQAVTLAIAGPRFARQWAQGSLEELKSLVRWVKLWNFVGATAVASVIATLGQPVVTLLTGTAYEDSAKYATLLCLPVMFGAIMGPAALLLVMSSNERVSARLVWCMAVVNAGFNAVLIPLLGILGAVLSGFASEFFWQVSSVVVARRMLRVNTLWPGERL